MNDAKKERENVKYSSINCLNPFALVIHHYPGNLDTFCYNNAYPHVHPQYIVTYNGRKQN